MSLSSLKVGELSNKSFVFREIVWKIPDFFSLLKTVDHVVNSPSILFTNAIWCFQIYLNGQPSNNSVGFVNVLIKRIWSLVPEHAVFFKIFLLTQRGTEFNSYSFSRDFDKENSYWGDIRFSSQSELETQKNLISSSDGTVTVICQMRVRKMPVSEAHFQTELSETLRSNKDKEESTTAVHMRNLSQDFKELLLSEENSDLTIQVDGRKFRAHRNILGARSSVFASMFRNEMKEKATGIVDLEDCDPVSFPDFLHYLYSGSVDKVNSDNVYSLYTTADKYDVQDLKSECLEFIKNNFSLENVCDVIRLCLQHSETKLLQLASDFFSKNLLKIIMTAKWQAFIIENPVEGNELMIKALGTAEKNYS